MGAEEERRRPGADGVVNEGDEGAAQGQQHERALGEDFLERFSERRRGSGVRAALGGGARLLEAEEGQQGDHQARSAGDDEGGAPPVAIENQAAQGQAKQGPQRNPQGVDRDRPGAPLPAGIVGDQGLRRRRAAGLADPHQEPEGHQAEVGARQSAGDRAQAPHADAGGDQPRAVPLVGQPSDRKAENAVEGGEIETGQPSCQFIR